MIFNNGRAKISETQSAIQYAVDIVSLSKSFRRKTLGRAGYTTLKSSLLKLFRNNGRRRARYTHVIEELTLRIPQGASVGIIGKNGSGKSTLLKLITGIYRPDKGHISVNGRIAALIELGAGFHPDFTGRENLYLGGVMHGLTRKEIDERFADIVRFAELEDVIDDPVRTYSSGMFMRLGFSLAVHTDPDILIIDEVLAVGDAAFVSKCKERIAQLRREGKTLILVSHDLDAVKLWCDEALWLHDGKVRDRGEPTRVIDHYREFIERGEEAELIEAQNERGIVQDLTGGISRPSTVKQEKLRWGSREVEISAVRILGKDGDIRLLYHPEDSVRIEIDYKVNEIVQEAVFGIAISRSDGLMVHGSNTHIEGVKIPPLYQEGLSNRGTVVYDIERLGLLEGNYTVDIAIHSADEYPYDYQKSALTFAVRWPQKQIGIILPKHQWGIRQ